jgi:hypothetical protein
VNRGRCVRGTAGRLPVKRIGQDLIGDGPVLSENSDAIVEDYITQSHCDVTDFTTIVVLGSALDGLTRDAGNRTFASRRPTGTR